MDSSPFPPDNSSIPVQSFPAAAPAGPRPHAPPPPPPPRRGGWGIWLTMMLFGSLMANFMLFMLLGVSGIAGSTDDLTEKHHSLNESGAHKIAIINLEGVILSGEGYFKQQLDRIKEDDSVKAIVLRVNSPGGTVTGSDYMYHHLKKLMEDEDNKRPLVVSMGALCASGGYYVSMAVGAQPTKENVIFAEPTTTTGSIGVLIPHYDLSGLAEKYEIRDDSIKSHPLKAMGGMLKEMTPEEKAVFQGLVDDMFGRFKDVVLFGRPKLKPEDLTTIATGQVFTTRQALKNGLVDQEGFIEEAIARAAELANLNVANTQAVEYEKIPTLSDLFIGSAQARQPASPFALESILDLTVPRAYYMYSLLPNLMVKEN